MMKLMGIKKPVDIPTPSSSETYPPVPLPLPPHSIEFFLPMFVCGDYSQHQQLELKTRGFGTSRGGEQDCPA